MGKAKRVLLIVNLYRPNAQVLAGEIKAELLHRNMEVVSFAFEGKGGFTADDSYDICFSLGGDGTVLHAARTMAPLGVPIIPVNLGTLGFIAAVHSDEWRQVFEQWLRGEAALSRRLMLDVRVERSGEVLLREKCLNDAVISALGIAKLISLKVESEFTAVPETGGTETAMELIQLGQYRSDGLIVATPTGSTAYSAAAGGPILDPELAAMIINPICPFSLSSRPMVVPAHERVTVELEQEQRSGILLTLDGQVTESLEPLDRIFITRSSHDVLLVASDRRGFYNALRTKLNWSGGSLAGVRENTTRREDIPGAGHA
jgi:NAD+ kinase